MTGTSQHNSCFGLNSSLLKQNVVNIYESTLFSPASLSAIHVRNQSALFLCLFVCRRYFQQAGRQPRMVVIRARSWSAEQKYDSFPCRHSRLRIWSHKTGYDISLRVSPLTVHSKPEQLDDSTPLSHDLLGFHQNRVIGHRAIELKTRVYQATQELFIYDVWLKVRPTHVSSCQSMARLTEALLFQILFWSLHMQHPPGHKWTRKKQNDSQLLTNTIIACENIFHVA